MADVFISYRNTPDRRVIVRRLATILRAHEITVWWDYGLEAGESYRAQITAELASARVVSPLWCAESIQSPWVKMEAELGKDKLVPARLQKVVPPDAFEAIQAADLIGWDGAVGSPRLQEFVRLICKRLGRPAIAPTDMIEDLGQLPAVAPLPEVAIVAAPASSATAAPHDYAFWKGEWETHRSGSDLYALKAIAEHAPPYFVTQACARMAEIEAEQERIAQERAAAEARQPAEQQTAKYSADGRIKVDAALFSPRYSAAAQAGWLKPGAGKSEWFKDLDSSPEMVIVPAGSFLMGSPAGEERWPGYDDREKPQHEVTFGMPFAVGRHAVTRGQFAAFVEDTGHKTEGGAHVWTGSEWELNQKASWRSPGISQDDLHPVVNVSWHDAKAYAVWLSMQSGQDYRLLSEAEWEFAARAGTTTSFWWGSSITASQANYDGNTDEANGAPVASRKGTVPVGSFEANPWGLFNVHGNVWEWCEDIWHDTYVGAPCDGSAWLHGGMQSRRVVRGGSWIYDRHSLRSAFRGRGATDTRDYDRGFRVGRTL